MNLFVKALIILTLLLGLFGAFLSLRVHPYVNRKKVMEECPIAHTYADVEHIQTSNAIFLKPCVEEILDFSYKILNRTKGEMIYFPDNCNRFYSVPPSSDVYLMDTLFHPEIYEVGFELDGFYRGYIHKKFLIRE